MDNIEQEDLPTNYIYITMPSKKEEEHIFRIKDIKDESRALAWLKEFSDTTKSTWRKSRTYPKSGNRNVCKLDLRCSHNTDRRVTGKGLSKHTDCPAKMFITVKRITENTKVKDESLREYPTVVIRRALHNHTTHSPASLKHRDLSDDIKFKLVNLFRQGHGPASALRIHKMDLMREYGDEYLLIAADGKYSPSYRAVCYLYDSELKKFSDPNLPSTSNNDFSTNEEDLEQNKIDDKIGEIEKIFQRIKEGLIKDYRNYGPAVQNFIKNANSYGKTKSGFLRGLHTFCMFNKANSSVKTSKKIVRKCHKNGIGVQPKAIGRREHCISGRRKANVGRCCVSLAKHISKHDYTTFGKLPSSEETSPHDLLKNVEENIFFEQII